MANFTIVALFLIVAVLVVGCSSTPWAECATDAEAAYFDAQSEVFAELRDQTKTLGKLASEAGEDPSVVRDQKWLDSTRELPVDARAITERVVAMEPPQSVEDLHTSMIDVAERYEAGMTVFVRGAESNSGSLVTQAQQMLTSTGPIVDSMHERTENFCK